MLRLKEILQEKELTGKALAASVGVTQASISNIIKGNHFPKPELLKDIANVLDVDVRELFKPTKETEKETIYIKRNNSFIPIGDIDTSKIKE